MFFGQGVKGRAGGESELLPVLDTRGALEALLVLRELVFRELGPLVVEAKLPQKGQNETIRVAWWAKGNIRARLKMLKQRSASTVMSNSRRKLR